MKKKELISKIAETTGVTKVATEAVVNQLLQTITDEVSSGNSIELTGFGSFKSSERKARIARNPKTGEEIKVKASKIPSFKAGKQFKEAVKG